MRCGGCWRAVGGRGLLVAAILCAAPLHAAPAAPSPEAITEYELKAAFLYNFTKFVEWPDGAFHDDRSSLLLCVLGEDPFGDSLKTLAGNEVAGRKLTLLSSRWMSDPSGCQILFVGQSEKKRLPQILAAVRDAPVLTVGDMDGFLEQGGIINFILQGSRIRFEINQELAERAGIRISSKLLRLAARVVAAPRPGP